MVSFIANIARKRPDLIRDKTNPRIMLSVFPIVAAFRWCPACPGCPPPIVVEKSLGIDREAPLPNITGREFGNWFAKLNQPEGPEVAYYQGCSTEYCDPKIGEDTTLLLNALGLKVNLPTSPCCSLPMLSSGEVDAAQPRARTLVNELLPTAKASQTIVSTSTSCSMTLRSKYKAYLQMNDVDTKTVASAVVDLFEFLRENYLDQLCAKMNPMPLKVL